MKTIEELTKIEDSLVEIYYPHVAENLISFWGTSYFNEYADSLLSHTRKEREGFPFRIMMELQKIIEIHNEKFPHFKRPKDPWI